MGAFTTEEFERNFKNLYKPLCLYSLRITGDLDDAEDVVQQAFADVWDKKDATALIGNLKSYLYRVVHNRSLTLVSKKPTETTTDQYPDPEDTSREEAIYDAERNARLWSAIDKLPPERKKIFLMSKRDGMKYQEIADELRLSVKTVENQMGKALKSLRETAIKIYHFFLGFT